LVKRTLISALILVCVLVTAGGSFGASFADTKGSKGEVAVDVLTSIGLINGFPDGTFRPGGTVTRAQIAKIGVLALGYESAVEQASSQPPVFSDVPLGHWASGYIKVAAELGLINGYPNGTLQPEKAINYEEVLAIIVRLLGYEDVCVGTWPLKYLVKATELGVTRGVTFALGSPAPRGDVALFFYNILAAPFLGQWIYGSAQSYTVTGDTILARLGYAEEEARVTQVPTQFDTDLDPGEVDLDGDRFDSAANVDLSRSLGLVVSAWHRSGSMVYATPVTPKHDIVSGVIQDNGEDLEWVRVDGVRYRVSRDYDFAFVYNNLQADEWPPGSFAEDDLVGADARVILDADGDIAWLQVWQYDGTAVVTKVNDRFEYIDITYDDGDHVDRERVDLADCDGYLFVRDGEYDGEYIDPSNVKPLDLVHYFEVGHGGDYWYFTVVDDTATGEVEDIELTDSVSGREVTISLDGDDYVVPFAAPDDPYALCSTDDYASFAVIANDYSLADLVGTEATLHLDRWGRVYLVAGDVTPAAPDQMVGLVKTEFWTVEDADPDPEIPYEVYVRVFGTDGKSHKLQFDGGTKIWYEGLAAGASRRLDMDDPVDPGPPPSGITYVDMDDLNDNYMEWDAPTLVACTVGSDGFLNTFYEIPIDEAVGGFNEEDIDARRNLVDGYRVYASTVFFEVDLDHYLSDLWFVRPWDIFKAMDEDPETYDAYEYTEWDDHDTTLDFFVLNTEGAPIDYAHGHSDLGLVLSRRSTPDGPAIKVLTDQGLKEYLLLEEDLSDFQTCEASNYPAQHSGLILEVDAGDVITYGALGGAFLNLGEPVALDDFAWDSGDPDDPNYGHVMLSGDWVHDDVLTVYEDIDLHADDGEYVVDPDCLVFDGTGAEPALVDLEDVTPDLWIQVLDVNEDGVVDVIKIVG